MKPFKILLATLLAASMLCLSGCWNYQELDSLSVVVGMAVDRGMNGYKYHLTFEFLDLTKPQTDSKLLETDGNTIFDAVRNATASSERKLYFPDCKLLLISEDIASDGVAPIFDWIIRDQEPRLTTIPLVTRTKTAREILQQSGASQALTSVELWRVIRQNQAYVSESPAVSIYEAIDKLSASPAISMVLPSVKVTKTQSGTVCELAGTAIFQQDRFIGYLTREESKLFLFVRNEVRGGLLVFSPKNDGNNLALELQNSKAEIKPEINGDSVSIHVTLTVQASLGDDETPENYVNEEGLAKAEASAENYLEAEIKQLIEKVQTQYDSDIFGFGCSVSQKDPAYWKKNEGQWGKIFRKLNSTVEARVKIDGTALARDKIKVG